MSLWDSLGRTQELFSKYRASGKPYNEDKKLSFGVSMDIAKNIPRNPRYYAYTMGIVNDKLNKRQENKLPGANDLLESGRVTTLNMLGAVAGKPSGILAGAVAGGAIGSAVPVVGTVAGATVGAVGGAATYGLAELDEATDGFITKALMSGTKGVRSNYAFVRDIADKDAALGLLAWLGQIGGAVAGGAATGAAIGALGGGIGAIPGAIAGAAVGAWGAGKIERVAAESGAFDSILKGTSESAKFAQDAVGQEKYNFGRDSTRAASHISGWKTLGDTSKGIGAITSGIVNIFTEAAVAPDLRAAQAIGKLGKAATVGGITEKTEGPLTAVVQKFTNDPVKQAERLAADVEVLKKAGKGEKTPYEPIFKFMRENDEATIAQRVEFRGNEIAQIAIPLLAGKSDEVQSMVFRVSRGDITALTELEAKHPATFAQIMRYEGTLDMISQSGNQRVAYGFSRAGGENIVLSKRLKDNVTIVENELNQLKDEYSTLNKMLKLDSSMQERTVSVIGGVEKLRNDIAKQRAANKLGVGEFDLTTRETMAGKVMQKVFTNNSLLGVVVRKIERSTDDAPHMTVNFNDMITGSSRVRTSTRAAVDRQLLASDEAIKFNNTYLSAKTEIEKTSVLDTYTERVFEQLGNKYQVPGLLVDHVLKEYIRITKGNKAKAQEAKSSAKAFMIDEVGDPIADPQLISQLANGYYLPDVELLDKAFSRYSKKMGAESSLPVNTKVLGGAILGEFESLWRSLTLARTGFPINIMRDSTLRAWGDGALFYMVKDLTETALNNIVKHENTVSEIRNWTKSVTNRSSNLRYVRAEMETRDNALRGIPDTLKRAGYDPADPKTVTLEVKKLLDYQSRVQSIRDGLAKREQELVSNKKDKIVGRDSVNILGYEFPKGGAGRFGRLSYDKIRGKDDMRGLLASQRELEMANIVRDRKGGHVIEPTQFNEKIHLKSWETVLVNSLANDPIARLILSGKTEKEVIDWVRSPKSGDYVERFGYDSTKKRKLKGGDAAYIYNRVLNAVNQFAPDSKLWKPILENKLDVTTLKQMYPDWQSRPIVITDLAEDLLGQTALARRAANLAKDGVAWLATAPTSVLSYNPYFNAKYEHKLQNMVAMANQQGRKLSEMQKDQFEATARAYALGELKSKINAFNRDMNYPAIVNHLMAFFPAVVEQARSYGRIMMDHPEFPYKIGQMTQIPSQLDDVKLDQYGTPYVEVSLPLLGDKVKGRLPADWFNAVNPTGGHILSAGPASAFTVNVLAKKVDLPDYFLKMVMPFGTQANDLSLLTPNQIRRFGQAFEAQMLKSGSQFNKDTNMFMERDRFEFEQKYHRKPNNTELANMQKRGRKDATALAWLRFFGSNVLPAQPRYVSTLEIYSDLLTKYTTEFGVDGARRFSEDYPEYYLLADKLTDSTSAIRPDDTAIALVKKNEDTIVKMVTGTQDLTVLGAVFNDDNFAFSSTAQAYLIEKNIPGTSEKFKSQQDALKNNVSSIVSKGWKDWNALIENVTVTLRESDPPRDVTSGYGASILDAYKKDFIAKMKTENNLWYEEKMSPSFQNKISDTVKVLTIAANTPKLWKDLAKQPRWHTVVDYLNYRYEVYDELQKRGTTFGTDKARDIRIKTLQYVGELRRQDPQFGKFYDRYFDGDEFQTVYEEQAAKEIK